MSRYRLLNVLTLIIIHVSSVYNQQANVNLDWNPQKNTQNFLPFGTRVLSPEVFDDHTVIFRVYALMRKRFFWQGLYWLGRIRPGLYLSQKKMIVYGR